MDIDAARVALDQAIYKRSIEEIIEIGGELLREDIEIQEKQLKIYQQALAARAPFLRLEEAVHHSDDQLIAFVWRNNYEQLALFVQQPLLGRVMIALERVQRISKVRRAFRLKNIKEIVLNYDSILFKNSELLSSDDEKLYYMALNATQLLIEIEQAAGEDNEGLLVLLYPEDNQLIERSIPVDVRRKVHEARLRIFVNR